MSAISVIQEKTTLSVEGGKPVVKKDKPLNLRRTDWESGDEEPAHVVLAKGGNLYKKGDKTAQFEIDWLGIRQ